MLRGEGVVLVAFSLKMADSVEKGRWGGRPLMLCFLFSGI
jgi:hypothetical protein